MPAETIPSRFFRQARVRPNAPAYYVRHNEQWIGTTWRDYVNQVGQATKALHALGVKAEESVCILGFNRPEWVTMDLANMTLGGAPAGIYTTCSANEVQYIVAHAQAPVVLVENTEQWEKIKKVRNELPRLRYVVMMKDGGEVDDPMVLGWEEFIAKGDGVADDFVEQRLQELEPKKVATLIYTSGTTGPPKGVMLTHENLAWTAKVAQGMVNLRPHDCSISYLPLSHIAEQMFTIHGPVTSGASVYFAQSLDDLPDDLKSVQPTVFFGVPRIWEKFYTGITTKLEAAEGGKAKLLAWARKVGREVSKLRNQNKELGPLLRAQYVAADTLVFSKLKDAIGLGRARVCVSGAAPISVEILEFFAEFDLVVHEVYGQSEDSGPTSFNLPGKTKFGTVGPVVPGVEVQIAVDGEILVRGPNVFAGYFNDKPNTEACLVDGWLHSGDLGEIDAQGFLSITGRKKDIIITAGGKNIAPKNIESAIKNLDIVGEAVLVGDRRKYLSALISLDIDKLGEFATKHGLAEGDVSQSDALRDHLQTHIDGVNSLFARVEHVRKFTVLKRPLSVENGELTPTLKVKRKVVYEHFAAEIEGMYTN